MGRWRVPRFITLCAFAGALSVLAAGNSLEAVAATGAAANVTASQRPSVTSVSPPAGPAGGGATVTIRGARFAQVSAVLIGGAKARNVHVVSAGVLTAVTPAHAAGGAAITVREKAGTSPASAVRYHYLNRPVVTGMSPRSGPVTGGQVVTITGRGLTYVRAVQFGSLRATPLAGSTATLLRARTPASWAGVVPVLVTTWGGTSGRTASATYAFRNPAPKLTGSLTPAPGVDVAAPADVTAVTGGPALRASPGTAAPWTVTLSGSAAVPSLGQGFLLKPGGTVYPSGLAGTVTAVDGSANPPQITVSASATSLSTITRSAQATFTGPLGDAAATSPGGIRPAIPAAPPSLTSTIDFAPISASTLNCKDPDGRGVDVSGSLSLKLENVEAHVEVDTGGLLRKPFVDVWISYQPTVTASFSAGYTAQCTLPASWQNTHQKLFVLGDTGATIAIAPDATFTISAEGSVSYEQHSYRMLGFISNPDGTIKRLDGKSADPAHFKVSGELKAEAYAGVQVQVGFLDTIGVGMSVGGGLAATATADWPPQVCLSAYPFLRATLYAYLNAWVKEWKLQAFSVELDLSSLSSCDGGGWHETWKVNDVYLNGIACPTSAACLAVGRTAKYGYAVRTRDGGAHWSAVTVTAHTVFSTVACVDANRCIAAGSGGKVAVTANGGAAWTEAGLPAFSGSAIAAAGAAACVPNGTCYVIGAPVKWAGSVVYKSTDAGKHWSFARYLTDTFSAMTCLSASACVAVGMVPPTGCSICPITGAASAQVTRDGWFSSSAGRFPSGQDWLWSVSCLSTALCYAGPEFNGKVLRTTDFGKTWQYVPDGGLSPNAMSCNIATCVLGGDQAVEATKDGGRTWTRTVISKYPWTYTGGGTNATDIWGLACPAPGHCVATENGWDTKNDFTAIVVS
jgi:hypothetical protein